MQGEKGENPPRPSEGNEHQAAHIAAVLGVQTQQLSGLLRRHPNLLHMPARHLVARMQRLAQALEVPMLQVKI